MGFLDDIISGAGRAGEAITANAPAARHDRLMEIADFAAQQGYAPEKNGLIPPEKSEAFKRDYPELAAEADQISAALATSMATGNIARIGAPPAAAGALPPPRAAAGEVIPPRSSGAVPPPSSPSRPTIDGTVISASSGPPGAAAPLPAAGGASIPVSTLRGNPNPIGSQGPIASGAGVGPLATIPKPPTAQPASAGIQELIAWARANPKAAGAAAILAIVGAGASMIGSMPSTPKATATEYNRPSLAEAGPAAPPEPTQAQRNAQREADDASALSQQQAQFYEAQRKELERRLANSNMTDTEKEAARAALETKIHDMDNAAAAARTAATEAGQTARTTATIAGEARNTDARIASENRNTDVRVASDARNTDVREAGANTRSGYEGQVTQRGQDEQARAARANFVVASVANALKRGEISEKKANDFLTQYFAGQKLPSEILNNVTASMDRLLPYRRNGNPGDAAPDQAAGNRLARAAGGKGRSQGAGLSDYDPWAEAKAMAGTPAVAPAPIDVAGVFSQVDDTSQGAMDAAGRAAAASYGGLSPQIQMPSGMATPPMDEATQQRIYNQIGAK